MAWTARRGATPRVSFSQARLGLGSYAFRPNRLIQGLSPGYGGHSTVRNQKQKHASAQASNVSFTGVGLF